MINAKQIRAARALLDWSTAQLAEQAELTVNGINKIERGHVQAQRDTLETIQRIFEGNGIEFLKFDGIRFRPEGVEVLNGKDGVDVFWNMVFAFAQMSGGVIRQNGIAEKPLDECAPEAAAAHRKRMMPLVQQRKDIFVRAIIEEGDMNFLCTDYADYRWNPRVAPPPVPYYIFGDSVAIFAFESDPSPKIILITSPIIASAYSKQFDRAWELAIVPSTSIQNR
jgi:transcriptional regulator with XRE-family HTH domain